VKPARSPFRPFAECGPTNLHDFPPTTKKFDQISRGVPTCFQQWRLLSSPRDPPIVSPPSGVPAAILATKKWASSTSIVMSTPRDRPLDEPHAHLPCSCHQTCQRAGRELGNWASAACRCPAKVKSCRERGTNVLTRQPTICTWAWRPLPSSRSSAPTGDGTDASTISFDIDCIDAVRSRNRRPEPRRLLPRRGPDCLDLSCAMSGPAASRWWRPPPYDISDMTH